MKAELEGHILMNSRGLLAEEIWGMLRFFSKHGGDWFAQVHILAGSFNVSEKEVREMLVNLYSWGLISLKTWSNAAWREVPYCECPTPAFFYNRDDANYVRVKPLISF
jgi:hypothetical protein